MKIKEKNSRGKVFPSLNSTRSSSVFVLTKDTEIKYNVDTNYDTHKCISDYVPMEMLSSTLWCQSVLESFHGI